MQKKKPNKRKIVLILDGNNLLHRSYHAMGQMSFNGRGTGAVFGFLNIMQSVLSRFKPDKIIGCFDDGRNANRLKVLPSYKDRDKNRIDFDFEDFKLQQMMVLKMLKSLGIPSLYGKGLEADDFIYMMAKKYEAKGYKVVIVSGDKDFRQLVTKRVLIFDNNKGLISPVNFKKLFVIEPNQYADYLCLDGDVSDKIPGVPGIGPATAIKLLKEHGSVTAFLGNGANVKHPKYKDIQRIYPINRVLINLRVFDDLYGSSEMSWYKNSSKPKPNVERYTLLCNKMGLKKFKKDEFLDKIPNL